MVSNSRADIARILRETRTIAVVGASTNPVRPSYYVVRYLLDRGFNVIPINPSAAGQQLFGTTVHATLADIPRDRDPIDMVEVFRAPDAAPAVVREAVAALGTRGLQTIWLQLGVVSEAAAEIAHAASLQVVMDRCPKIEHARTTGELSWSGINTGVISSRR